MTESSQPDGTRLRLARQARGLSQQQLAGVAGVTRQAVSAVESGHSDPSLRVALGLARALGMTVEELFGPGEPGDPVLARPIAPVSAPGSRVALATVGDTFVALPLDADLAARLGFGAAGGLTVRGGGAQGAQGTQGTQGAQGISGVQVAVRPIGPPRPTVVVAGCDPALPLLETPLALLDPPLAFAWWPCGSAEALRLAAAGLVHAAGVHRVGPGEGGDSSGIPGDDRRVSRAAPRWSGSPPGARAWWSGPEPRSAAWTTWPGRDCGWSTASRERRRARCSTASASGSASSPSQLTGYDSLAAGHLQVAAAIVGGLADAGVSSEPAALAYGLDFIPLAEERFDLLLPAKHAASREVQGLLKVLTSPWLLAQLASLPGYDAARCGERPS